MGQGFVAVTNHFTQGVGVGQAFVADLGVGARVLTHTLKFVLAILQTTLAKPFHALSLSQLSILTNFLDPPL